MTRPAMGFPQHSNLSANPGMTGRSAQEAVSTLVPGMGFVNQTPRDRTRDFQVPSAQGNAPNTLYNTSFSRPTTSGTNRDAHGRSIPGDTSTAPPGTGPSYSSVPDTRFSMRGFPAQGNFVSPRGFSFATNLAPQSDPATILRGLGSPRETGAGSTTPNRRRRVPRPIYIVAPPQHSDAQVTNPFPSQPSAGPPTNPFPSQPAPQAVNPDLAAYLASAGLSNLPAVPTHEGYDNPTDFMPIIPFYPSTSSPPSPTRPPVDPDPTAPFNREQDMPVTPPMSPLSHRDAFLRPRTPDPMEPDHRPITQGQVDGTHYGIEIGALGCSSLGTSDRLAWMGERRGRNDSARAGGWNPPEQGRRVESLAGGFRVPVRRSDGWGGWEEAMRRGREGGGEGEKGVV